MIELKWDAPVSETKLGSQIGALQLSERQNLIDVGCGCGEVLIQICQQHEVFSTGIDTSDEAIAEAQRRASARSFVGNVEFIVANAQSWVTESSQFDIAVCLGASHAFGLGSTAYRNALEQLNQIVRPGGQILIAEGYVEQPIPEAYKQFIGDSTTDEMTHAHNVLTGKSLGLIPLAAWTSREDEWDEFEWSHQRIVEHRACLPNADRASKELLQRRRDWMDGYLEWGRDTLGYGTYLFSKPTT